MPYADRAAKRASDAAYRAARRARTAKPPTTPEARFWVHVDKGDGSGCWLWTGGQDHGYGRVGVTLQGTKRAHRQSWIYANGPIPPTLVVCHRCDVRLCVRPDHLFLGTHADNVADMYAKGRARHPEGEARPNAKLNAAAVREIRQLSASGVNQTEIARRYDVSETVIRDVLHRRFWRHIT